MASKYEADNKSMLINRIVRLEPVFFEYRGRLWSSSLDKLKNLRKDLEKKKGKKMGDKKITIVLGEREYTELYTSVCETLEAVSQDGKNYDELIGLYKSIKAQLEQGEQVYTNEKELGFRKRF